MKKLLMSILSLPIIFIILSTNVYAKDTNYSGDVIINYTRNEIALKQKEAKTSHSSNRNFSFSYSFINF